MKNMGRNAHFKLDKRNTIVKTKTLYRVLNIETGNITLWDYDGMSGYITLNEVVIPYDDEFKDEHRQLVIDAIDERKKKLHAEIMVLEQRKQEMLCITHTKEKPVATDCDDISDAEFEEIMNGNKN